MTIIAHYNLADLPKKEDYTDIRISFDGYGQRKWPTRHMVQIPGSKRWRRVYSCCISNAGTCYVTSGKNWIVIS